METRCVVLVGNSLLLDGVAASLTAIPGLTIVHVDPDVESPSERVATVTPDLVIFALDQAWTQHVAALLEDHPGLTLVGIHPEHSRLIEVNGRHHRFVTMQDLFAMLESNLLQGICSTFAHSSRKVVSSQS